MRPIDADAIKYTEYINGDITVSREEIEGMPTLTRCEECEHGMDDLFHLGYTICNYMRCTMKNDGYCSNALRRK